MSIDQENYFAATKSFCHGFHSIRDDTVGSGSLQATQVEVNVATQKPTQVRVEEVLLNLLRIYIQASSHEKPS